MLQNRAEPQPCGCGLRRARPKALILELQHSLMPLEPGTRKFLAFTASGKQPSYKGLQAAQAPGTRAT